MGRHMIFHGFFQKMSSIGMVYGMVDPAMPSGTFWPSSTTSCSALPRGVLLCWS